MRYFLMHKDDQVASLNFSAGGGIEAIKTINRELLPISAQGKVLNDPRPLRKWWKNRAVPHNQSDIKKHLLSSGIESTEMLLVDNLGLSLSDTYWVCPENTSIKWKEVSLFSNDFSSDLSFRLRNGSSRVDITSLSPAASTGGELGKKWKRVDGKICLIKGNQSGLSYQQSQNEVFASLLHRLQRFQRHVDYELISIGSSYGCVCESFTDEEREFIPAWEITAKYKKPNEADNYSFFIECLEKEGIAKDDSRAFMDYQTITDFLLTNTDRHLNNFGILRNSESLKAEGFAPIFDSGNSMLYDAYFKHTGTKDLLRLRVPSLLSTEDAMMAKVTNYNAVDTSKLPSKETIMNMYAENSSLGAHVRSITDAFEFKRFILLMLQGGLDIKTILKGIEALVRKEEKYESFSSINEEISEKGIIAFAGKLREASLF